MSHITKQLFEQLREALIHAACETPVGEFATKYSNARVALEAALAQPKPVESTPLAFLVYAKSTDKNDHRLSTLTFDIAKVPAIFLGGEVVPLYSALTEEQATTPAKAVERCLRCNTPTKCGIYGCCPNTWPSEAAAKEPK